AVNVAYLRAAEAVAPSLGVQVTAIDIGADTEIERTISTFASQPDGGLVAFPHPKTTANRASIIILAARHRLPAIYPFRFFAIEGGLMSYGIDQIDQWARHRDLSGSHPAGRQARRSAGAGTNQVRANDQPQDGQGDRLTHPAGISSARRRGD